jgi:glycosyltransferase involved in cell wall biosynthesis
MALGLPIVATRLPPLEEVLEDGRNAILVPPAESESLALAIAELVADPARRRRFGARSQEIFEARFELATSAERMAALYESVVQRGR